MVKALREEVAHEQNVQSHRTLTLYESASRAETDFTCHDMDAKADVGPVNLFSIQN